MRFGDYIREIRRDLNWTQPQAAKEIGIEQSYLSKLESGKSYPSEDVFSSIIDRYKIDLSELNGALFAAELDRLREVAQVRAFILKNERDQRDRVRNLLFAGIAALVLGGACIGTATLAEESEAILYQYRAADLEQNGNDAPSSPRRAQLEAEFRTLSVYRDAFFTETTPEGTQSWRLIGSTTQIVKSPLRWFIIPGLALLFGAAGLFFASYRMR
ncbi:MAG: helix-turn-helix domain-containing protein [Pseudomonadota bacterium]